MQCYNPVVLTRSRKSYALQGFSRSKVDRKSQLVLILLGLIQFGLDVAVNFPSTLGMCVGGNSVGELLLAPNGALFKPFFIPSLLAKLFLVLNNHTS